jgi:hypothetical protein
MIAATRKQFEAQLAAKEADFGRREDRLRQTQDDLAKAREALAGNGTQIRLCRLGLDSRRMPSPCHEPRSAMPRCGDAVPRRRDDVAM